MAKRKGRRYQRSSSHWNAEDQLQSKCDVFHVEDRKAYAGKVRLAIEKRHRNVRRSKRKNYMKDTMSDSSKSTRHLESGFVSDEECRCGGDDFPSEDSWDDVERKFVREYEPDLNLRKLNHHYTQLHNSQYESSEISKLDQHSEIAFEYELCPSACGSWCCSVCSCESCCYDRGPPDQSNPVWHTYEPVASAQMYNYKMFNVCRSERQYDEAATIVSGMSEDESWSLWEVPRESETGALDAPPLSSSDSNAKELLDKLREELGSDWESLDNVSIGLIYIPMEEENSRSACSIQEVETTAATNNTPNNEQDLFGSLESLIFEPKENCDNEDDQTDGSKNTSSNVVDDISDRRDPSEHVDVQAVIVNSSRPPSNLGAKAVRPHSQLIEAWRQKRQLLAPVQCTSTSDNEESGDLVESQSCSGATMTSWRYIKMGRSSSASSGEPKKRVTWKTIKLRRQKRNLIANSTDSDDRPTQAASLPCIREVEEIKRQLFRDFKRKGAILATSQDVHGSNYTGTFDRRSCWSDLESLIFADPLNFKPVGDSEEVATNKLVKKNNITSGRMNAYRDDWLFWDQLCKKRKQKLDKQFNPIYNLNCNNTWKAKAKRMMLWMYNSRATMNHGNSLRWSWWKAKQRASILWLTAKANNNKVPDDLKEPHYKDHDDQDQLKPVIVHALASAEYYCLALGNIYADPNYHHLNHWGVIQALARKGIYVAEPSDVALTETVLIQTSPIRMSAHMAVIEAIMALYIKESVTMERIVQAVKRFTSYSPSNELPSDTEDALVLWINKACVKMKRRIEEEMNANDPELQKIPETKEEETSKIAPSATIDGKEVQKKETVAKVPAEDKKAADQSVSNDSSKSSSDPTPASPAKKSGEYQDRVPPSISVLQDLSDLSDGCCLATLISFYCPTALKWRDICYNSPMSMADSLYNLHLVQKFCRDHLPSNPCFLSLEDLVYQHSSVRQNILAFVADLFFLLEIKPVKCVHMPGVKPDSDNLEAQNGRGFLPVVSAAGKRSSQQAVSPIPDLRTNNFNSMPDINRISPRSHTSPSQPVKEPMFPRRQVVTQPECRTLDRAKRYSFHEASRGAYSHSGGNARTPGSEEPVGSIRRTHSLLDIHKTAMEKGYGDARPRTKDVHRKTSNGETRIPGEAESEPEVYYVHRSRGFTPPSSSKVPESGSRPSSGYDDLDDVYTRLNDPLEDSTPTTYYFDESEDGLSRSPRKIEERLLPARLRPSKERNNSDSKMDERGEGERRSGHPSSGPSPGGHARSRPQFPRRASVDDGRTRHSSGVEGDPLSGGQYSLHDVPKYSIKNDGTQGQVGDSFIYPEKYSLESAKAAGIPIVRDEDYNINYEGYHDNRELEERLAAQNYEKTTLYVPGGDAHKTQYIIIAPGEKGKEEALLRAGEKQPIHTTSFAQLSKLREHQGGGINIVYMQHDRDHNFDNNRHPLKSSFLQKKGGAEKKTTTFAATPNTTTWQHQGATSSVMSPGVDSGHETPSDGGSDPPLATQLHNVRLKLEEKRRRIEVEKRRMELTLNRARQKLGKAAFLQAVTKGKGSGRNTPDSGASGDLGSPTTGIVDVTIPEESRRTTSDQDKGFTMQEIADNLAVVQNKWLESQMSVDTLSSTDSDRPSPDVDGVTFEEYTRSLDRLNTNLTDLQSDIHRLTQQQDHIQRMVQNGIPPSQPQQQDRPFYVGEMQQWTPPQHRLQTEQDYAMARQQQVSPAHRRSQWGPASTVIPVGPDGHMPGGSMAQQRLSGPPNSSYTYIDQHGYLVRQAPDAYPVLQQHGGVNLSSQNGPNPDQYTTYSSYGMPQHAASQSPYHPPMPPTTDVYTRYTPPQVPAAPAPFRLHVEGPPSPALQPQQTPPPPQQQSQAQIVYQQKPAVTQASPIPRPTSIHSPRPGKQFSIRAPPESAMEPQTVHFIEDPSDNGAAEELAKTLSSLESVSGTATYRVRESTSPTRPLLSRTFRVPKPKTTPPSPSQEEKENISGEEEYEDDGTDPLGRKSAGSDKGFFVAFDDDQPKRNKPPFRIKKVPRITHRTDGGSAGETESESVTSYTPVRSTSLDRSLSNQRIEATPEPYGRLQEHDNVIKVNVEGSGESVAAPQKGESPAVVFVIKEPDVDAAEEEELARKRERILLNAVKRKEEQEALRAQKEMEAAQRREQDRIKQEMLERKREEERARRQAIFEQYKQRKALEDQEQNERIDTTKTSTLPKTKTRHPKPRPKSLHESAMPSSETRSSTSNLASVGGSRGSRGSQLNLAGAGSDTSGSSMSFRYGDTDSGLGRSTPPRRAQSPGQATYRHPLSPSTGPPSLPPGLVARRGGPISDTASDTCSTTSSTLEYTGPKLFKQPTAKSNRGIVINAINSVLAGAVNQDSKKRALEEIAQSDSKHFLILFRDSGCQFRALYSYFPEKEEVFKLFGTGPKQVHEHMIDRYYKYNSGGKSFMEIQTKHLTVTIDAFTIHNSLWQGKKGLLPKKDLL